ncbi:MAG TPA: VpsF family polysaccharide biosynthesis protein [Rhodopila sp.]
MRALRTLAPVRPADPQKSVSNQRMRHAAFTVGLLAVIIEFAISGNTLENLGIDYASQGGNLLIKLHPGTYLAALGAFMALVLVRPGGSGLIRFFRETPALALFIVLILFCALYSIANVGFSGAAIYIESYLSAGLLAIALEAGSDRQKRALGWWIIGFCVLSIIISIGESATQTHLIPLHIGDEPTKDMVDDVDEFRGAGLFGHPLTAALATSMATFLLLRMRMAGLLKAALFTTLLIGLLSFGGRAALATTVIMVGVAAAVVLVRGVVMRNLSMGFVGSIAAAVVILPPLMLMLITSTDIGARILSHMYVDDSAQVRSLQWLVLQHLNLHDVLFGVRPDRLDILKYQIGLGSDTTDIENFWLLMFLNLGTIGFVVFLVALALFIVHLGRTTAHPLGWMLLLAAILIDSTSNSLGRKSADLLLMAAYMIAMSGFPRTAPAVSIPRRALTTLRQTSARLGIRPSQANLAGFKP